MVLLGRMPAAGAELLKKILRLETTISVLKDPVEAERNLHLLEDAEVIVGGPLSEPMAACCPKLKLFHAFRGGVDGLGIEHLPKDVLIANTYHHEIGIAEFVIMAMLMLPRQVCHYDRQLRKGNWQGSVMWGQPPQQEIMADKIAMIVGLGHIGREIAARAQGFGLRLVGVSRQPTRTFPHVDKIVGYDTWKNELPTADYVVSCVRLAPNTEGLFGAEEFNLMKSGAFFINVSRGTVAQEKALYEALRNGKIGGAAIDVWYQHPKNPEETCFPSSYHFHELTNILMSPNRSSWTKQMLEGRIRDVAENIERLAAGKPLINLVGR